MLLKRNTQTKGIIEIPVQESLISRLFDNPIVKQDSLIEKKEKLLNGLKLPSNAVPILIAGAIESLTYIKIIHKDFKKIFSDSQKEVEDKDTDSFKNKNLKSIPKKLATNVTKLDRQIARFAVGKRPLTEKMMCRLNKLEASGYLKIMELNNKKQLLQEFSEHRSKISLSRFDRKIINGFEKIQDASDCLPERRVEVFITESDIKLVNKLINLPMKNIYEKKAKSIRAHAVKLRKDGYIFEDRHGKIKRTKKYFAELDEYEKNSHKGPLKLYQDDIRYAEIGEGKTLKEVKYYDYWLKGLINNGYLIEDQNLVLRTTNRFYIKKSLFDFEKKVEKEIEIRSKQLAFVLKEADLDIAISVYKQSLGSAISEQPRIIRDRIEGLVEAGYLEDKEIGLIPNDQFYFDYGQNKARFENEAKIRKEDDLFLVGAICGKPLNETSTKEHVFLENRINDLLQSKDIYIDHYDIVRPSDEYKEFLEDKAKWSTLGFINKICMREKSEIVKTESNLFIDLVDSHLESGVIQELPDGRLRPSYASIKRQKEDLSHAIDENENYTKDELVLESDLDLLEGRLKREKSFILIKENELDKERSEQLVELGYFQKDEKGRVRPTFVFYEKASHLFDPDSGERIKNEPKLVEEVGYDSLLAPEYLKEEIPQTHSKYYDDRLKTLSLIINKETLIESDIDLIEKYFLLKKEEVYKTVSYTDQARIQELVSYGFIKEYEGVLAPSWSFYEKYATSDYKNIHATEDAPLALKENDLELVEKTLIRKMNAILAIETTSNLNRISELKEAGYLAEQDGVYKVSSEFFKDYTQSRRESLQREAMLSNKSLTEYEGNDETGLQDNVLEEKVEINLKEVDIELVNKLDGKKMADVYSFESEADKTHTIRLRKDGYLYEGRNGRVQKSQEYFLEYDEIFKEDPIKNEKISKEEITLVNKVDSLSINELRKTENQEVIKDIELLIDKGYIFEDKFLILNKTRRYFRKVNQDEINIETKEEPLEKNGIVSLRENDLNLCLTVAMKDKDYMSRALNQSDNNRINELLSAGYIEVRHGVLKPSHRFHNDFTQSASEGFPKEGIQSGYEQEALPRSSQAIQEVAEDPLQPKVILNELDMDLCLKVAMKDRPLIMLTTSPTDYKRFSELLSAGYIEEKHGLLKPSHRFYNDFAQSANEGFPKEGIQSEYDQEALPRSSQAIQEVAEGPLQPKVILIESDMNLCFNLALKQKETVFRNASHSDKERIKEFIVAGYIEELRSDNYLISGTALKPSHRFYNDFAQSAIEGFPQSGIHSQYDKGLIEEKLLQKKRKNTLLEKEASLKKSSQDKSDVKISKFDSNIVSKIKAGELNGNQSTETDAVKNRIKNLLAEGYIEENEGRLKATQKYIEVEERLITLGLMDDRDKVPYKITEITESGKARQLKRNLPKHQKDLIKDLKVFGNLTESQIESFYGEDKRYFHADIKDMLAKNLIKKEIKTVEGKEFNLYHLADTGNKFGEYWTGIKLESRSYSKNEAELLHDLLQYEAYKVISNKLKEEGSVITKVLVDRAKRSEIYVKNFKDIGDENKTDISDIEIKYKDNQNKNCTVEIEIDRGYKESVIQNKSVSKPDLIWFTDSKKQADKIQNNAVSYGGLYLIQ